MKLLNFIIKNQIFVAFCGTCLAIFFMLKNDDLQFDKALIIFTTLFCGYQYTKFQQDKNLHIILILGLFCLIFFFKERDFLLFLKWFFPLFLGFLYNSRTLQKSVRSIPFIKVFYIGFVWAFLITFFPTQKFHFNDFLIVFFLVSALVLPFDIRDIDCDTIITFPKTFGIKFTKYLAYSLIFSAKIIAFFTFSTLYFIPLFFNLIFCSIFIYFSEKNRADFYFSFWVELGSAMPLMFLMIEKLKY